MCVSISISSPFFLIFIFCSQTYLSLSPFTDDGSMVDAKRQISLEAIKSDPDTKVILISFKAGSTGESLTLSSYSLAEALR